MLWDIQRLSRGNGIELSPGMQLKLASKYSLNSPLHGSVASRSASGTKTSHDCRPEHFRSSTCSTSFRQPTKPKSTLTHLLVRMRPYQASSITITCLSGHLGLKVSVTQYSSSSGMCKPIQVKRKIMIWLHREEAKGSAIGIVILYQIQVSSGLTLQTLKNLHFKHRDLATNTVTQVISATVLPTS